MISNKTILQTIICSSVILGIVLSKKFEEYSDLIFGIAMLTILIAAARLFQIRIKEGTAKNYNAIILPAAIIIVLFIYVLFC